MLQHLLIYSVATAYLFAICCNYWVNLYTTGASSAFQFHILPLEETKYKFWPSPSLPQWYIWSVMWAFYVGLQFSFQQLHQREPWNSETPLSFHQTHPYQFLLIHKFAHHPCNTDIIPPQIICMLLTFGTLDSHATSIITNAMYSIIILLQCVAGGGKKMIVLTFWTDIFEQDLFYHVIIGFYHQKILHQVCDKLLLLLCS